MQLRIKHTTGYTYETDAVASYNEARMSPMTTSDQYVLRTRVDVTPTAWSTEYRDYWGATVTAFELHEPHRELTVVATSTVETNAVDPKRSDAGWADIAAVSDVLCEFVQLSDWVDPPEGLRADLAELRASSETPGQYVTSVAAHIAEHVAYLPGVTAVTTKAADAWDARAGVCQDFAHLVIGALRTYGIPARYVSGYLHPSPDPVIGETVAGESHAWVEWWDGEWVGFDPTNGVAQGERHVLVTRGRDYSDGPPLRGIFSTSGESEMFVAVEITRVR